jgi:rhodanese-related sulfurtransferase
MAIEIDRGQLQERLAQGTVVIEVLPEEEYARLHIKGAINIPIERIGRETRGRFEPDQALVVYCSDRECPTSGMAAKKLEAFGFTNVLEYADGKHDWELGGGEMESGAAS